MIEYKEKPKEICISDELPRGVVDSIINGNVKAHRDIMPRPVNYPTE